MRVLLPLVAACVSLAAAPAQLDGIARDYVRLTLEAGEREPGYVDAYYGPAEWAAAAKVKPRTVAELRGAATALKARALAVESRTLSPLDARRRAALISQLTAAETRLAMNAGKKFGFAAEAEGLFSVRPVLRPLADYDAILAEVATLLPGDGALWSRVDTFRARFVIPPAKVDAVMRAATAECRRRTVAHIPLPVGEKFTLELVTGKPWSGYNYYKGNNTSLIQINTDLPIYIDRAVDLGCHEGYPGHHVYNVLIERELAKRRGWIEFTVYALYSPMSLLAEGSANYGIDLALPPAERAAFETRVLYLLAGLDTADAPRFAALNAAIDRLGGARFTIARDYLDGRIDRAAAVALTQRYLLLSPARAEKSVKFTDTYRSYVINYGLGRDLVRAKVEAAGPGDATRWAAMARLLSEPTTAADLTR